jgi:uncharacterized protein (DUF1330 family)
MAAYVIALRERIKDPAEMEMYKKVALTADSSKAKALAVYGAFENLEHAPYDTAAILEFPTMEDAKAWYYSAEYSAAREHRQKGSDFKFMIVQGV